MSHEKCQWLLAVGLCVFAPTNGWSQDCPPWALYFGPVATTDTFQAEDSDRFVISMRNASDALAFQFGVSTSPSGALTAFEFSDQLGLDETRLIEILISDEDGNSQEPETPNTATAAADVLDLQRGSAIAAFEERDFFAINLEPGAGGPGFTVGYVSDLDPPPDGGNVIPATPDEEPCPLNEILVVLLDGPPPDNNPPDCSGAHASVEGCWPPNHKFVHLEVLGVTDPDGDAVSIRIDGITQDEPALATGRGSGRTCPDGLILDMDGDEIGDVAAVRCERDGRGNGRVYEIAFTAIDARGLSCTGSVSFCVVHDRADGSCVDDGQDHDSMACPEEPVEEDEAVDEEGTREEPLLPIVPPDEPERLTPEPLFIRGDVNWDDETTLVDGALTLLWLMGIEGSLKCVDAADVNDDGRVNISDPITLFSHLFQGGVLPPPPSVELGADPTPDELECRLQTTVAQ